MSVKDTGGRPTLYNDDIIAKTRKYLVICQDEEVERVKVSSEKGYESYDYKLKVKLPTIGGLARYLEVSRDTIYEWKKEHEEFSDIIEQIMAEQEDRLINNGMSGDYNSTIAKVLLTKHGYREGIENTGKDGKDLIPDQESKEAAKKAINEYLNEIAGNTKRK